MKSSPFQVVTSKFNDRKSLVEKLAPMVDDLRGEGAPAVKSRLNGLSNTKLLRLYNVEQKVRESFGDRKKLIAHIVDARTKAGLTADDTFKAKLDTYSKAQLLDLTKQNVPERPAKQTPEQKLKGKRGRKERERALSKIKS